MSEIAAPETPRPPTVYFIDDSATMREVMKIAFRRENIGVVACQDAATALTEIEQAHPDVVITDVIMPDKNGFEVCQYIKQHPQLGKTPVVLLSGVVNREVADKAFSVKADELIRKPFQPQDLIARVKQLLAPKAAAAPLPPASVPANAAARPGAVFGGVFGNGQPPARAASPAVPPSPGAVPAPPRNPFMQAPASAAPLPARTNPHEPAKLRLEVMRLENLVKKLQSELAAEREYARALEAHVKTLQESE
jgi:CheY-like chemotaxis protein